MKPRARIRVVTPAPRKREETELVAQLRLEFGQRPDLLLSRIETGVFCAPNKPNSRIRSAPTGFPDLIATQLRRHLVRFTQETHFSRFEEDRWETYGQAVAVETKTARGRLTEDQNNWRIAFEKVGGIYIVARSVEEVLDVLGPVPEWVR